MRYFFAHMNEILLLQSAPLKSKSIHYNKREVEASNSGISISYKPHKISLIFPLQIPFTLLLPFIMENPHRLLGPSVAHNVLIYVRQSPIKRNLLTFFFTVHYSGKFLHKKERERSIQKESMRMENSIKVGGVSQPLLLSRTSFTTIQNYHIQFLSH